MNPGILTPPTQFATMPRGLLGRPTPVPVIGARRVFDPDAERYIAAVERADGRPLEEAVRVAVGEFVIGCKEDGIWTAIRASCILMGARTLPGALTPLVGPAPTNNGPFVAADYVRGGATPGLVGNASTKFLDANRLHSASAQNNSHMATWVSSLPSGGLSFPMYFGGGVSASRSLLYRNTAGSSDAGAAQSNSTTSFAFTATATGFKGFSRSAAASFVYRAANQDFSISQTSVAPTTGGVHVFGAASEAGNRADARLAFYSIGDSLTLSSLNSRIATLVAAMANVT